MKYGIFGGTFDPIHEGHIHMAKEADRLMAFDKVWFVPAGIPPHKDFHGVTQSSERLHLVELALKPYYPHFEINNMEVVSTKISYTVNTIEKMQSVEEGGDQKNEWYLILGIDSFLDVASWKDPERLFELCNVVILPRKGYSYENVENISCLSGFDKSCLEGLETSDYKHFGLKSGKKLFFLNCKTCDISSTKIRSFLKNSIFPYGNLSPEVVSYIIEKKLFMKG